MANVVEFLKESYVEMTQKVSWPTWSELQNSAVLVRNSIKRLEFLMQSNPLVGEKDPEILNKTEKLKSELKQIQIQLIEVPVIEFGDSPEEDLDKYFNNPKVNKKYRMKKS